jgi:hypothetical protein
MGAFAALGLAACHTAPTGRSAGPAVEAGAPSGVVPFSSTAQAGLRPIGWHDHVMRRDLPATRYDTVEHDGRIVAHAVAERSTSGLRCDVDVDPRATPWLEWSWRVDAFDATATVARDECDDAPTRVVIAFDGDLSSLSLRETIFQEQVELFTGHRLPFATLMYVWDGSAAPESVFRYARSERIRYMVVESGPRNTGRWLGYRRNVAADYRRVFGAEPGRIRSVGVMTDTDDLKTRTEAWFGDIRFC